MPGMKMMLTILTLFVSLTALAGGFMLIMDPKGGTLHISQYLRRMALFSDFLLPGILLLFVVGGINAVALIFQISRRGNRNNWTLAGAVVLLVYILIQILIIGEWNWLQILYLFVGGFMVLLTWQLRGKWAA
jgi:predicted MFS family arabinose efflux permease